MSEQQARAGVDAERLGENMLGKNGWRCQHAKFRRADYEGAEIIGGENETVRDPDLLAIGTGETVWVEIKEFGGPNKCKVRSQKEHGVRKPKMEDYRRVADLSGIPVWLFIVETNAGLVLVGNINDLPRLPPIDKERCIEVYDEVVEFFPRDQLEKVEIQPEHRPSGIDYSLTYGVGEPLNDIIDGVDKTPPGHQAKFDQWQ